MTFSEWLDQNWEEDNMCPPPLDAQDALDFLKDYLLGENWYVVMPLSQKQCNTEIVATILKKYSSKYRKELAKSAKE